VGCNPKILLGVPDVVRTPFAPDVRLWTRRSLDDQLFVRWPAAWAALGRLLLRLPPRSRLRRGLLRRNVLSGWSAWSRGDLDLMLVRYAPEYQLEVQSEFVGVGTRNAYYGHVGLREWAADLRDSFHRIDITPVEVIDAGDRLVILGKIHFHSHSGVELDSPQGQVLWLDRGVIVRESFFFDTNEALHAADIPAAAG
jgi:ketosteroid isomerase-like protein